jgi:hypothetical protein
MTRVNWQICLRWTPYLLLAGFALASSGCIAIAAGAAGGAAAGYAYCKGKVCATYNAGFGDALAATRAALGELGMPVLKEEVEGKKGFVVSRTPDGEQVRIYLEVEESKLSAEGSVVSICVRVATFGDHLVSHQILSQVDAHLIPKRAPLPPAGVQGAPQGPPQTAPPPTASSGPGTSVVPAQTSPPPLLPAQPVPAAR